MKLTHQLAREQKAAPRKYPIEMTPVRYGNSKSPARVSLSPGRVVGQPPMHQQYTSRMQNHPQLPPHTSMSPLRIKEVIFIQRSSVSPIRKRIIEAPQGANPQLFNALDKRFCQLEDEFRHKFSHLSDRASHLTRRQDNRPYPKWQAAVRRTTTEPSQDSPLKHHHHPSFGKKEENKDERQLQHSTATIHRNQAQEPRENNQPTAVKADRELQTGSIIRRIDSDKDLEKEQQTTNLKQYKTEEIQPTITVDQPQA